MGWETHEDLQMFTLLAAFFAKRSGTSLFSVPSSSFDCLISSEASELHQNGGRSEEWSDFRAKSDQSARSVNTSTDVPGKTASHLVSFF